MRAILIRDEFYENTHSDFVGHSLFFSHGCPCAATLAASGLLVAGRATHLQLIDMCRSVGPTMLPVGAAPHPSPLGVAGNREPCVRLRRQNY